jgi:hypothetical protein
MTSEQITNIIKFAQSTENFAVSKGELDFLMENLYIVNNDPMYLFMLGVFITKLGGFIQDEVKDKAIEERKKHEQSTIELYGSKFQLRKTPQYIYPKDDRISNFESKIKELEEKANPYLKEIKSLKDSIKTIEKQLVVDNKVLEGDPKYTPIII